MTTARVIAVTNDTTPPREMMVDAGTACVRYAGKWTAFGVAKQLKPDLREMNTQGSVGLITAMSGVRRAHLNEQCVFTVYDQDAVSSIAAHRTFLRNWWLDQYETYVASQRPIEPTQLTVFTLSDTSSTDWSEFKAMYNAALSERVLPHLVGFYDLLLPTTADLLAGYEQYEKDNWDSYGAKPITRATRTFARKLLKLLPTTLGTPDVAPAGDGTIALEWVPDDPTHKLKKLFLDIGPGEEWTAYWRLRDGTFGTIDEHGTSHATRDMLQNLFNSLSK